MRKLFLRPVLPYPKITLDAIILNCQEIISLETLFVKIINSALIRIKKSIMNSTVQPPWFSVYFSS